MAASEGADALITFSAAYYAGASIVEKSGQPLMAANLQPMVPTRAYSNALMPPLKINNGTFNLLSHHITLQLVWQILRPVINDIRQGIQGLDPWPVKGPWDKSSWAEVPILHGYSRHVLPRPDDWPENIHVTGYWFLEHRKQWQPDPALAQFLAAGEPPVYVGFGSMRSRDPQETAALVIRALDMAGQRGILLSGWGGLAQSDLPHNIFMIESIPHDWLFPRMSAVVHHGGAGTTAAGLRAGIPSILIPFFADQPYWGAQIERLGVGPKAIRRDKLAAPRLAAAIRTAVTNHQMQEKAAELGRKIRTENGVETAVNLFNHYFDS
jgi:UDP:flavonoid glycosyltransferase YjiC (YdhE family)